MKNEDAAKVLHAVRDLAPAIASRSAAIEEARRLPADLLAGSRRRVASGCSCRGATAATRSTCATGMDVLEALARATGPPGWTVMIGSESHLFALLPRERFDAIYAGGPDVIIGGASTRRAKPTRRTAATGSPGAGASRAAASTAGCSGTA